MNRETEALLEQLNHGISPTEEAILARIIERMLIARAEREERASRQRAA